MKYLNWLLIGLAILCLTTVPLAGCVLETGVSESEYRALQAEYEALEADNASLIADLEALEAELAQLKATKEINFGNGLRVFDIEVDGSGIQGKIENVSDAPMKEVAVLVAYYDEDGSLCGVGRDTVENLFVGEVLDWSMHIFYGWSGLFDIYAIGNRSE